MKRKKAVLFLMACVVEIGILGLGLWQIYLYLAEVPLARALDFAPEDVTRIEVRHAGGEAEPWVCGDPEEVREAAEYLAAFRYTKAVEVGSRSGWLDVVEVATPSETYQFELYPNAIEIGGDPLLQRGGVFLPLAGPLWGRKLPIPSRICLGPGRIGRSARL